jgi:hypothetical protein
MQRMYDMKLEQKDNYFVRTYPEWWGGSCHAVQRHNLIQDESECCWGTGPFMDEPLKTWYTPLLSIIWYTSFLQAQAERSYLLPRRNRSHAM